MKNNSIYIIAVFVTAFISCKNSKDVFEGNWIDCNDVKYSCKITKQQDNYVLNDSYNNSYILEKKADEIITAIGSDITIRYDREKNQLLVKGVDAGQEAYSTILCKNSSGNNINTQKENGTTNGVTDIDGNVYTEIKIGNQIWMKENLRVSKYNDGSAIINITDSSEWFNSSIGAFCYFDNDKKNDDAFGKIYNWYAVSDKRGLCPKGWHIPSDDEWLILEAYLGLQTSELSKFGGRGITEGGKLKSKSSMWKEPNTGATNSTNFSALPGGYGRLNSELGVSKEFDGLKTAIVFHTASFDPNNKVITRGLRSDFSGIDRYQYSPKNQGYYCRCLKD